jgi:hypothetical protein
MTTRPCCGSGPAATASCPHCAPRPPAGCTPSGRHPADQPWSRKHADTQRRLCTWYLAPVIANLRCEDIKIADMEQVAVNAALTSGEGGRLARCISALVNGGPAAVRAADRYLMRAAGRLLRSQDDVQ